MNKNVQPQPTQPELFDGGLESKSPPPWQPTDGRDELNLAEFPLAALSNRVAAGQKTLVFKDTIYDAQAKQRVERQLTVMAADKFGLPTAVDDEIILALIQLSKRQGFSSKTVPFSRYEIIQVLGWEDESWNYRRIIEALDRWISVTLKYENAWWEPTSKAWVDETFHIIERLTEVKDKRGKERSAFVWSDVIFQNLQSGNLKPLDLELYRRLTIPTAKRLYRLLDKRFYRHRRVEFDLIELAFHKLGISQNYLIGNIKQRLQPAIEELEAVGYIKPCPKEERYQKHGVGKWHIRFERGPKTAAAEADVPLLTENPSPSDVEAQLIELGVSSQKARRLVTTQPDGYLRERIDVVRYLKAKGSAEIKNPAGYLVKSIEEQYALPEGYQTPEQRVLDQEKILEQAAIRKKKQNAKEEQSRQAAERLAREEAEKAEKIASYLNELKPNEREKIAADAVAIEVAAGRGTFLNHPGKIGEAARKTVVDEHVLTLIDEVSKPILTIV